MKYNFNNIVDRKGSCSMKWDLKKEVIPLWVADMDFHVATEIEQALITRAKHGVYGYSILPGEYYNAITNWWDKRHNTTIKKDWIIPTLGVIPALSSCVAACTSKNDNVIVVSPVYQYFYSSIVNNGANIVYNPLVNQNGRYSIDYELLEDQAKNEKTKMLLLCNPHNPVGRVWSKEELKQVATICKQHNVIIVSDEIHRDLTYEKDYTPMISFDDIKDLLITCTAPSKTFNIAGLKTANIVVSNQNLREKVKEAVNKKEAIEPSIFGIDGLIAAYKHGEEWLDQVLEYIKENREYSYKYFKQKLPNAVITPLEGTYLLWIDLKQYGVDSKSFEQELIEQGVYINGGYKYGESNTHIRINLATSRTTLKDGYDIITTYINNNYL